MQAIVSAKARWQSDAKLRAHFRRHGAEVGAADLASYDASARQTIRLGKRFTYVDPATGVPRVGYYDIGRGLFTGLTDDERYITTHFRPADGESYLRALPSSTYR